MSLSKADPVNDFSSWLGQMESTSRDLKVLQLRCEETIPDGLGFEIAHWDIMSVSRTLNGGTLEAFSEAVKAVAKHFGPPDETYAQGSNGRSSPDLYAIWNEDGRRPVLKVRCWYPKGCKIDPRTEYEPEKNVAIHPECAAVLKGLEE